MEQPLDDAGGRGSRLRPFRACSVVATSCCRTIARAGRRALLLYGSLGATGSFAQSEGAQLVGHVVDASSKKPLQGVTVTAWSPSLQGEQAVVTDDSGNYRVPQLPLGNYTLHFEKESYRAYERPNIELRTPSTVRLDVEILPNILVGDTTVVVASPVDVGSASTGVQISAEFIRAVPLARNQRSFDQLAVVAPGVQTDAFGPAIGGTTSPETQFLVDGLNTTNVFRGLNRSPVSVEFVDRVNVVTGGFMPEYGGVTGGVVSAFTKSGGNEFHGSVFGTWTPGALQPAPPTVSSNGSTFSTSTKPYNSWDIGGTLGGYIIKDRLWFFAGFDASQVKEVMTRTTNFFEPDSIVAHPIPGTDVRQFSPNTSYQYMGKLTFLLNSDQRFSVAIIGAANSSISFPAPESNFTRASAKLLSLPFFDITGKWHGSFIEKVLLVAVTAGWHHEPGSLLPTDGAQPGGATVLGSTPLVNAGYQNLTDLIPIYGPVPSQCDKIPNANPALAFNPCPVNNFYFGGPGYIAAGSEDSVQGTAVVTWLARALGNHIVKVGFSIIQQVASATEAYTGAQTYTNMYPYGYYLHAFGVLTGPDAPLFAPTHPTLTTSTSIGGFIQDSWNVLDKVTLNIGVRYDAQNIYGTDGKLGMSLLNEWSPRVGVIWDPTYQGRSRVFASFGIYYETVPASLGYSYFPGLSDIASYRSCNPIVDPNYKTTCLNPATLLHQPFLSSNAGWQVNFNGGYVDPDIHAQSSSEVVLGAEYEIFNNARLGATFIRRWINRAIEDMSPDEGATAFIGNPGYGIAANFPKAVRNYTAVSVALTKTFADFWQAQLSYTYQSLVGNYEGLIRTGSGTDAQLSPNNTALFDLRSLVPNSSGRLPGDITHTIKAFGSYEWVVNPAFGVTFGGALTANSGMPYSYLGESNGDGPGTVYILTRGKAGTLPWVWNLDLKLSLSLRVSQGTILNVAVECFNVLNSAQVIAVDENYTFWPVLPIVDGTAQGLKGNPSTLRYSDHKPYSHTSDNLDYGKPQAYQPPRAFRFSARVTF